MVLSILMKHFSTICRLVQNPSCLKLLQTKLQTINENRRNIRMPKGSCKDLLLMHRKIKFATSKRHVLVLVDLGHKPQEFSVTRLFSVFENLQ